MSMLCKLFGHALSEFPTVTQRVRYVGTAADTVRDHHIIEQKCTRCRQWFIVGQVTVPNHVDVS